MFSLKLHSLTSEFRPRIIVRLFMSSQIILLADGYWDFKEMRNVRTLGTTSSRLSNLSRENSTALSSKLLLISGDATSSTIRLGLTICVFCETSLALAACHAFLSSFSYRNNHIWFQSFETILIVKEGFCSDSLGKISQECCTIPIVHMICFPQDIDQI